MGREWGESTQSAYKAIAAFCMNMDNSELWDLERMRININQKSLSKEGSRGPRIAHHIKPESSIC